MLIGIREVTTAFTQHFQMLDILIHSSPHGRAAHALEVIGVGRYVRVGAGVSKVEEQMGVAPSGGGEEGTLALVETTLR